MPPALVAGGPPSLWTCLSGNKSGDFAACGDKFTSDCYFIVTESTHWVSKKKYFAWSEASYFCKPLFANCTSCHKSRRARVLRCWYSLSPDVFLNVSQVVHSPSRQFQTVPRLQFIRLAIPRTKVLPLTPIIHPLSNSLWRLKFAHLRTNGIRNEWSFKHNKSEMNIELCLHHSNSDTIQKTLRQPNFKVFNVTEYTKGAFKTQMPQDEFSVGVLCSANRFAAL